MSKYAEVPNKYFVQRLWKLPKALAWQVHCLQLFGVSQFWMSLKLGVPTKPYVYTAFSCISIYSVRGLEWSELGGSHSYPRRLWARFLWQVYQNDTRHDALDGVLTCHKNRSHRRPGQPWDAASLGQSIACQSVANVLHSNGRIVPTLYLTFARCEYFLGKQHMKF